MGIGGVDPAPRKPVLRSAVRIVMVDPDERILLIELIGAAGAGRWWIMPGGGLDAGESHEQAAYREAAEETGLTAFALGPWVWRREHVFTWKDTTYRQQERFYIAHVPAFEARPTALAADELEMTGEMRWWSLDELDASRDQFAPQDLPRVLRELLRSGPPADPIEVGV